MSNEAQTLVNEARHWIDRVDSVRGPFDGISHPRLSLPIETALHLQNLAEAIAECEHIVQTFAGRIDASKEMLGEIANRLRRIHQRLDDVVLPASIAS